MFKFIDHPDIPKTSNALESFFGHLKDNLRVHRGLSLKKKSGSQISVSHFVAEREGSSRTQN